MPAWATWRRWCCWDIATCWRSPIALTAQAVLARRAGRAGLRRWLWSLAAIAALNAIVAATIARGRRNALYWLPHLSRPLVEGAVQEFTAGLSGMTAVRWVTVLAILALTAAAVWRLRGAALSKLAVPAWWGLAPPAILLAVSAVEPVFWPRYAILAVPGLCLLAAEAAGQLWAGRRTRALAVAGLATVAVAGLIADGRQRSVLQENWPPIAAWLRAERTHGAKRWWWTTHWYCLRWATTTANSGRGTGLWWCRSGRTAPCRADSWAFATGAATGACRWVPRGPGRWLPWRGAAGAGCGYW